MKTDKYPELHWTPERVSRFWDWQSQYPETYFTYLFGAEIVRSLQSYLAGRRRVLDYGCGTGYLLPYLCRCAEAVYGADLSPESIAHVNERLKGMPSFEGAMLPLDLRRERVTFDAILVVEVIEHLYDAELDKLLSEVRAILTPGGVAIFTTPNNEDREKNMILCPATGEVFHRWQHVRSWNKESLPSRLRTAGFTVVEVKETNLAAPMPRTPYKLLKYVAKRLLLGNPGKPHLVCVASAMKTNS